MYEVNLVRSAMAPETIVAAVAAKTSWKKNFMNSGTLAQLMGSKFETSLIAPSSAGTCTICSSQHEAAGAHELVADAEHQPEAHQPEHDAAEAEVEQVLHADVDDVLGPGEAGFDQAEAGLHEHDQAGGDHHPHRVDEPNSADRVRC